MCVLSLLLLSGLKATYARGGTPAKYSFDGPDVKGLSATDAGLSGPLHMLQNELRRLPRLAAGRVHRQRVRVRNPEHLDLLAPPADVGQVDVLQPRPTIRCVLAPADDRGLTRQPHGEEPGSPLPRQPFDTAEPCPVEWLLCVERVREDETGVRRAEVADDGQNSPMDFLYLLPRAVGEGKGVRAVVAQHAEDGRVNKLVIDDPGPGHPPDLSGDRILPDGRDADQVDDGVLQFHIQRVDQPLPKTAAWGRLYLEDC